MSLTIVGFASGSPQSQAAMACVARDHKLVAIVMPHSRNRLRQFIARIVRRQSNPLAKIGVPIIGIEDVARLRADLIVVASFPKILPADTLAVARLGAL